MSRTDNILQVMRERRSVRRFLDRPVPRDVIERLVEAAALAPSAGNLQDWRFAVVAHPARKARMGRAVERRWQALLAAGDSEAVRDALTPYAGNFTWFPAAPVVIAVSCRRPERFLEATLGDAAAHVAGRRLSAAMAAQNLMLAACATGLGTCCLTGPAVAQEELKEILEIDTRREIVCLIALGHPAEQPAHPPRKSPAEIARFPG